MSTIKNVIEEREEAAAKQAHRAAVRLIDADSDDLRAQLEMEESLDDLAKYSFARRELATVAEQYATYGPRSKSDLLRDMLHATQLKTIAQNRLASHQRDNAKREGTPLETRDLGPGSVFASVPGWMVTNAAPTSIPSAPLLRYGQSLLSHLANDVRLVGFTTPPVAAPQSALNASVSTVDITDNDAVLPIRTFASAVLAPEQLISQGPGVSAQLIPRMIDAVNAAVDASVIAGDGTGGSVVGLMNTPSASTQTWTSASPDATGFLSNLEQLTRKVEVGRGGAPVVMLHSRRLSWLREKAATSSAPIPVRFSDPQIPGATVTLQGSIQVIADNNIPTNISSNQDACVVLRGTELLDLYTTPPVVFVSHEVGGNFKVRITVRRYAAFSAARLPSGVGVLSGSGLVAP
jgi:hypothetical protein